MAGQRHSLESPMSSAILLIAHTLPVVAELSDRIGVIQYGHLKGLGTLAELRQQDQQDQNRRWQSFYWS